MNHSQNHHMDHMDHSDHHMDHSMPNGVQAGNMADHGMHSMGGMHMMMYFHFGVSETILFDFWRISSELGLISSMFGLFFAALFYEGLKYMREQLFWKNYSSTNYETVKNAQGPNPSVNNGRVTRGLLDGNVIYRGPALTPSMFTSHHIVQTILHLIQIVLSYLLMLIFMTYNVWLCLAVALGSTTGYFLFGWKKSLFVDYTEHCH